MNNIINLRDFKEIEFKNGVIVFKDYMFLHRERPKEQFEYLLGNKSISGKNIEIFQNNIKHNMALSKKYGFQYKHIVLPAKPAALKHMFAEIGVTISPIFTEKHKNPAVTYATLGAECFDKYETHCNDIGSVQALFPVLEEFLKTRLPKPTFTTRLITCDLAKMYNKNDSKKERIVFAGFENIKSSIKVIKTQPLVQGSQGTVTYAVNKEALFEKRILLFGSSSIGNAVNMLSHIFTEVLFLYGTYITEDIVTNYQPDIVLTGGAERFLSAVHDVRFPIPSFLHYLAPRPSQDAKLSEEDLFILKKLFNTRKYRIHAKISTWYFLRNALFGLFLKKKAYALCRAKKFQDAGAIAQSFIVNNPSVAWAYYILAKAQWDYRERALALKSIEKAIELEPHTQYFAKLKSEYLEKYSKLMLRKN